MSDLSAVKALVFDVFGTVVDWRTSLINDFTKWGDANGKKADSTALVDGWRAVYAASMDVVRKNPQNGYVILDVLHRQSLEKLVEQLGIKGLSDADLHHLTMGWHRLYPWPDSVAGLTRLKKRFIIAPLSNGNIALMTDLAKHSGLPWDCILGAELVRHYKPDPEVYQSAAELLDLERGDVMMVAAHLNDLRAAKAQGLKTAFVPRPMEYGPAGKPDLAPNEAVDVTARNFVQLASTLGAENSMPKSC